MIKNIVNQYKTYIKTIQISTLFLIVLCLSQPAFSEVNLLGSWVTGTTHTKEAGSNRLLVVVGHAEGASGSNPVLSAVTYGGQTMTKIADKTQTWDALTRAYVAIFILNEAGVAAASGSTITPTWSGTSTNSLTSGFLGNVDQSNLIGDILTNGIKDANAIATSALATSNGDMVVAGVTCTESGTYTPNNGFTEGVESSITSADGCVDYKSATGAAETPSVTHSTTTNNRQAIIGFVAQGVLDANKASHPSPGNGISGVSVTTGLSWDAPTAYTPTSYNVYFGTNPTVRSNPKYTVYTNSYDPPSYLTDETTYYWAADSNNAGTIYTGGDWNFTTYVPIDGDLVANYVISLNKPGTVYYADICAYYGVLVYSELTGNTAMRDSIIAKFPTTYYTGATLPPEGDVDRNVYGIYPFELYRQTGDANYLTSALYLADREFANPRPDGLSAYTRFWIDDTYMIGSLQTQAYKSMGDIVYANRAVTQLLGYMGAVENMQQANGLFYHTLDSPNHWGRGNGWAAASMTEVLLAIPENHPQRAQLLGKYQTMMAALVNYQGTSGMWYQVLNMGSDPRNWYESSCTGMFIFALATGVREGWLPEEPYKKAALDGWAALAKYVDAQGRALQVCTGTGSSSDVQFYFDRPREIGNTHAEAAVIWAATAMERLLSDTNTPPPAAPTGLSATAGNGSVSLNWNDNSEPNLDGYNVYCSTTSGSGYSQINGSLVSSSNYTDNSATNGITYYYVVTAVDTASNESGYSNEDSATPSDTTAPTPDPLTWFSFPTATGQSTITMTATTATDATSPPVQYFFECTTDGSKSSSWQSSATYIASGLNAGTQYSFRARARDSAPALNMTGWSSTLSATTSSPDTTPPTPDPLTWSTFPTATGASTITMTASTATDTTTPPVQYYFECTNDGTKSSSWQSSATYIATGLNAGTQYSFRARARDSVSPTPNVTGWSSTLSATTNPPDTTPPEPNIMTWLTVPTATGPYSITMTATTAIDAATPPVQYLFECTTDGSKSSSWQSSATYAPGTLSPSTLYSFRARARDSAPALNMTAFSSTLSATTQAQPTNITLLGSWVTALTHTKEAGNNRALIFIAHAEYTATMNLSAVTYGGQAMTKVVDYSYNAASGWAYAAAYILKETGVAAASSSTFSVTWSTTPGAVGYSSAFFSNVDQTTSTGATGTGGSTTNPVTTSALATNNGDMVILGATCGNSGAYTLNNSFIEGNDQTMGGTATGVTGHKAATGVAETPSATYSSTINRQMIIGFVLKAGGSPTTYTISGNAGTNGATMSGLTGNPVSDANGNYTGTVTSGWSGTVTPTKAGYTFSPVNRVYTNVTSNQTAQNYTATLNTYTISGNAGTNGATMNGLPGSPVSDSNGNYTGTVNYNWSGTVTPTKTGYTFSPVNRVYTNVTSNQTAQNYTATLNTYTISGNAGTSGATMSGLTGNPVSDANGNYTGTVTYNWSGTVTPTKTGYTFSPVNRVYTNVTSNQTAQNYTATLNTYTISGNAGTNGATMSGLTGSPVSDANGNYTGTVTYGWSGTVTPTKTGYTFSPVNRVYTNVTSNQTAQNYTATLNTYTISGNAGTNGATMSGLTGSPVSDANGNYTGTVTYGWSGTVTPTKTGYTFSPVNRVYTNVTSNQTAQNYTATINTYTISGSTTVADVNLVGLGVVSDGSGNYTKTVNYGFSATVTPAKAGYTFSPVSRTYTSVTSNQTAQNYTATLLTYTISGNAGTSGATMSGLPGNPVSDGSGNYTGTVGYGFSGTVTPLKAGYSFSPVSRTYTNVTSNQTAQNYTATLLNYKISGYIKNSCNIPIAGVLVIASNGGSQDTTDSAGFYEVWVSSFWSGTVTPSKLNYTFSPVNISYSNVQADAAGQNYTASNIYDLDCSGLIGWGDVMIMADNWLATGTNVPGDLYIDGDNIVNLLDLAQFSLQWLVN